MNQAVPSADVIRSFIALMPGLRSFQPSIFEVSSGCSSPASRHLTTLCEQGCARSALKPERSFWNASSSSPKKVKVGSVAVLFDIGRMEGRIFVAGPVEDEELVVRGDGDRRAVPSEGGRKAQAHAETANACRVMPFSPFRNRLVSDLLDAIPVRKMLRKDRDQIFDAPRGAPFRGSGPLAHHQPQPQAFHHRAEAERHRCAS